jgi:hypothetical protein
MFCSFSFSWALCRTNIGVTGHMATIQLNWWKKTSGARTYIISGKKRTPE